MRGLFAPPVFDDQEKSLRAQSLFYLLWFTAGGVAIAMAGMTLAQPELIVATSATAAVTLVVCLALLILLGRGHLKLASLLCVVWGIGMIAQRAVYAGGIRSPGIPMLYVFALIAGFLLGETAGIATAVVCALIGLILVGAEHFGFLPAQTLHYTAMSYWWLDFLYLCVVLMLVRLAIRAVGRAFASQQKELAERRNAERKLHVALEAGEIGVWEWVPSTGKVVWDERMYRLYGKAKDSPLDYQSWAGSVLPGELSEQEGLLKQTMEGEGRAEREFRIRTPDGVRIIFAAEMTFPAQDGEPLKLIGINVDVTKRRKVQAEALALKGQLETLVDKAKVGILIHRKFKPLVANPELAAIFGSSVQEVMALPDIRVVMTEQMRERAAENYLARMEGGDPGAVMPVRCRRKDGSWIDVEARSFPIYWNGEPSMCAMITDVTQRRKLEAQLRQAHRLEAVGRLTGGIAHDFNNLLTVILGNADALERMLAGNHPASELAALTRAAAERGSQLTNRLLSFSRQQTLNIQPADVEAVVTAAHGLIRGTIGDKVEIRIEHGERLWRAFTDAAQMESALLNLAINARDAMPEGGVLTIETRNVARDDPEVLRLQVPDETGQMPPPGDYVLVAVRDTGIGMDEETRSRAFEPFFTTKDVGKGSGLGLSMVYGFVNQLRGLIRIESEPGSGTAVKLYLPRAPQAEAGTAQVRYARPVVGGSEKILLVEDNDLVREQCAIQLKRLGYHVLAAEDGEEALAILDKEDDIRLLFSDVSLPKGLNGPELAARVRTRLPGLPVLLSSGYAAGRVEIASLGVRVAILTKPYYQDQLAAVIRDLLG
jgi:PAS domain S-box-containing protein